MERLQIGVDVVISGLEATILLSLGTDEPFAIIESDGEDVTIDNRSQESDSKIMAIGFQVMAMIMAEQRREQVKSEFKYTRAE